MAQQPRVLNINEFRPDVHVKFGPTWAPDTKKGATNKRELPTAGGDFKQAFIPFRAPVDDNTPDGPLTTLAIEWNNLRCWGLRIQEGKDSNYLQCGFSCYDTNASEADKTERLQGVRKMLDVAIIAKKHLLNASDSQELKKLMMTITRIPGEEAQLSQLASMKTVRYSEKTSDDLGDRHPDYAETETIEELRARSKAPNISPHINLPEFELKQHGGGKKYRMDQQTIFWSPSGKKYCLRDLENRSGTAPKAIFVFDSIFKSKFVASIKMYLRECIIELNSNPQRSLLFPDKSIATAKFETADEEETDLDAADATGTPPTLSNLPHTKQVSPPPSHAEYCDPEEESDLQAPRAKRMTV